MIQLAGRVTRSSKPRGSGRLGSENIRNLTGRVESGGVGLRDPIRPDPGVLTRPVNGLEKSYQVLLSVVVTQTLRLCARD